MTLLICMLLVFLLEIYMQNIVSSQRQLNELPDALPVFCKIVNLNGSQESGLEIPETLVNALQESARIKDVRLTNVLLAGEGDFAEEDWKGNLNITVVATNSINAVSGLSEELIALEDGIASDFLQTDSHVCIVGEDLLQRRNWSVGDTISLNLYYYMHVDNYQVNIKPLELVDYKIEGTMGRFNGIAGQFGMVPEILVPFETVRESYHRKGVPFSADSAAFYVENPLELNEFKEEMHAYGLLSKAPNAKYSYQGNALVMRDSSFIAAASKLRQGIDILVGFLPAVLATVILIGYIISTLLTDSRQTEYALMRIQGMGAGMCFLVFFMEQLALALSGGILSSIFYQFIFAGDRRAVAAVNLFFLISYLLGSVFALLRLGKRSTMEVLFRED